MSLLTTLTLTILSSSQVAEARHSVLVEAEAFDDVGGWVIDQQFMDLMSQVESMWR